MTDATVSILIDPAATLHTGKPVELNVNGSKLKLAVDTPISIPAWLEPTLAECNIPFRSTGVRDQDVLDVPGADVSGGGAGGVPALPPQIVLEPDPETDVKRAALLKLLDQSIPALTESLVGLTMHELDVLLAAEVIGKTRAGAVKAIEQAQQALSDNPAE